jgi:hypothetical protein
MAERLATLPAKQVACVRFPVPARPTFSVEKWLFSVTLRPGARCKYKIPPLHCRPLNELLLFHNRYTCCPGGLTI